jgi:hypothetical protein
LAWDLPSLDRAKVFAITSPILGTAFGHDKGKFAKPKYVLFKFVSFQRWSRQQKFAQHKAHSDFS